MKAAIMNDELYLLGGVNESYPSPQVFVASLDTLSAHKLNWQSAPIMISSYCSVQQVLIDSKRKTAIRFY